jgi:hypothetical protein
MAEMYLCITNYSVAMENTLLEKVLKVIQTSVRDDNNKLMIPDEFVELCFKGDPDVTQIREKAQKAIDLANEAEEKNDIEFLNRDFETDIWLTL